MVDNDNNRNSKRFSDMPHRKLRSDFDGKIAGLYDLEETIGEGHFAVVKLARHVFTGEKVAVKVIDKLKLDDVSRAHLFQEVRCMKLVQHPNVVRLYEVIDTQTKLYLILELGDGGDMYDYIMKHTNGLEEGKARIFFRQIVEAISYCHKLHVVHRDLKPENVVFFKKLEVVKLTDFGFSNMFNPGNKLETSCGSLAYSAPEILLGDSYDAQAVDIWSLGVILYMLVCGEPPFREANDSETLTMIMDCKYKIPAHVSVLCQSLISVMLKREPGHRANLSEIENHEWLKVDSNAVPHYHLPLISREQVSKEDHDHVVEKMVEGCIATKEEILQSLEKDMYNHITATYYLLAERRLRRHRQELLNQASMMHIRKNSAPSFNHGKPHLEPLALSPRKPKEVKKTRTEPLKSAMAQMLSVAESPGTEFPVGTTVDNNQDDYFKSLTQSMTLGRRPKTKADHLSMETSHTPSAVSPRLGNFTKSPIPLLKEPCSGKKPKHRGFSKIAILSSFFESKIAALASSASPKPGFWKMSIAKKRSRVKQRGLPSIPMLVDTPANCSCEQLNCDHCVKSKEAESTDEKKIVTKQQLGLVSSLLSPPGTHPTPSSSLMASPTDDRSSRKFSLIQEESLDEATEGEEEDMELEGLIDTTVRMTKSAEQLDLEDNSSRNAKSPSRDSEQLFTKRPLLSVASSPQLLNQIYEENESDEEDDIVPAKLNPTSRLGAQRNSLASPELIRKYEARKKHRGAGSRGTSCSSSDASDTDDTDGRSRKNKLKHKFIHRRDSSDHSSDTDGGPSGHGGGGLGKGFDGGNSGGGGGGGPSNDGEDKRDGGGKKDGKSGSQRSGGHHSHGKQNNLHQDNQLSLHAWSTRTSEMSVNLGLSSLSLTNKSSLKYVLERDENVSDSDAEDNGDESIVKETNKMSHVDKMKSSSLFKHSDCTCFMNIEEKHSVADEIILCPQTFNLNGNKHDKNLTVQMDINSNMFFKQESCRDSPMKIETKCCSLV